jgi:hypothetical protein
LALARGRQEYERRLARWRIGRQQRLQDVATAGNLMQIKGPSCSRFDGTVEPDFAVQNDVGVERTFPIQPHPVVGNRSAAARTKTATFCAMLTGPAFVTSSSVSTVVSHTLFVMASNATAAGWFGVRGW